jgi:1-acyl-sn-glycerol-3-phosphate acyltransferase
VPCALIDSYKPFDEKSAKPVTVTLYYLSPIIYDEYAGMKTKEIAAMVKQRIEQAIDRHMDEKGIANF